MGLIKSIKKILFPVKIDSSKIAETIVNLNLYDDSKKTIVFVPGNLPPHDKDSGSNRLKEIMIAAKETHFNVVLWTNDAYETDEYIDFYKQLGFIIYVVSKPFKNAFDFLKHFNKLDYVWYYGPNTFKRYFDDLTKTLPNSSTLYDMVDIHFLRIKRAMELEPNKISHKKRYKKYFEIETQLIKKCNYIIAISDTEKQVMAKYITEDKILTISNVHYAKILKQHVLPFQQRNDILFIGSTHAPNIDAVYFLYQEIMPLVWQKNPNIKLNIIGNLNEVISDIQHENIIFHGFVPNVDLFFKTNKFMVAPLRFGAGVKGKLGQAFEYYLPLITTGIGAEGMFLKNNVNALIENEAQNFANAILNLYENEVLWNQLSNQSEQSLYPFSREKLKETLLTL